MPLPTELRSYLPREVAEFLDLQWVDMVQRQNTIHVLQGTITHIRCDLQSHDVSTRDTPTFSALIESSSTRSELFDTPSDTVDWNTFAEASMLAPGIVPTRVQLNHGCFTWHTPPSAWSSSEKTLLFTIGRIPALRRLWRIYAATNSWHSWYDINHDSTSPHLQQFTTENASLNVHVQNINTPHLRYALTSDCEDFCADSLKIKLSIGGSVFTTTPRASFLPTTPVCPERKAIKSKRQINYRLLDDNLRKTNLLLHDCPCPRLARVARFAKIPLGRSLRIPGILIYAIIGSFPPYVGQLGAKTMQHRTPLHRLMEHCRRAKSLRQHFQGQRKRNLRTHKKLGHKPSLPRTLARVGRHSATIVSLHFTDRQSANRSEHATEPILAPTLNGVTPYSGEKNIEWLYGACNLAQKRCGTVGVSIPHSQPLPLQCMSAHAPTQ